MAIEKLPKSMNPKNIIAGKAIEKVARNEYLTNRIDKLKNNPAWQKNMVGGFWNKLTEKDKLKLYKEGSLSFTKMLERGFTASNPLFMPLVPLFKKYDSPRLKLIGPYLPMALRYLVQIGLLPSPQGLTPVDIIKDIKKDQRGLKCFILAVEAIVGIFAPECVAEMQEINTIIFGFNNAKTIIAQKQQGKEKKNMRA